MSSNLVTTVTINHIIFLREILQLIDHNIPIVSFSLKGNNLDTQFSLDLRELFISNRLELDEKISCREIIHFLTILIENNPIGFIIESFNLPMQNLEHFLGMLKNEFVDDIDVRRLFKNPILENLTDIQN
jgi:hypothetical protein